METIIVAVIGLIGTLASVYFVNKKTTALIIYRGNTRRSGYLRA